MLELIDTTIEALLRAGVPLSAHDIDVSFDAPSTEWAAKLSRPTVNLFLWDVKLSAAHARTGIEQVERNGVAITRLALPRVELRYLVTAWTSHQRDERSLFGGLLSTILRYPRVPGTFLAPQLQAVGVGAPTISLTRSGESQLDVFRRIEGKLKPALDVIVVTDVDTGLGTELPPPVTDLSLGTADMYTGSRRSSVRRIAGEVRSEAHFGAIVTSPRGASIVDQTGRFLINAQEGDEIIVAGNPPLTAVVPAVGGVVIET